VSRKPLLVYGTLKRNQHHWSNININSSNRQRPKNRDLTAPPAPTKDAIGAHSRRQPSRFTASITIADAPPPPLQIAAHPMRAPRARSTVMSRAMMMAPVAPSGWPSASAPPCALTLHCGRAGGGGACACVCQVRSRLCTAAAQNRRV